VSSPPLVATRESPKAESKMVYFGQFVFGVSSSLCVNKQDPLSTHEWILFMAGDTVAVLMPGETMTICQVVSIEYRNVTDGRTDRIAISISPVSMLKRNKN